MKLKTTDIIKGAALLGGIAHVMIYMNGYWNDAMWLSAILSVGVPLVIHKYLKIGKRRKRVVRLPPEDI